MNDGIAGGGIMMCLKTVADYTARETGLTGAVKQSSPAWNLQYRSLARSVHLKRDFGVVGVDWHLHANGIDFSVIREKHVVHSPSIAKSQILMRDYEFEEIYVVLFEQIDEVAHRLRLAHRLAKTVQFSVGTKDGEVFRKQFTVKEGINNENDMMKMVWRHLLQMADTEALYRTISVSLTNFIPDSIRQVSLFEDMEKVLKEEALVKTIDELKVKYGQLSVACPKPDEAYLKLREGLIAGHKRGGEYIENGDTRTLSGKRASR